MNAKTVMSAKPGSRILKTIVVLGIATCSGQTFAQSPVDELNDRLRNISIQMKSVGQSLQESGQVSVVDRQKKIVGELNLLVRQFSAGEQTGSQDATQQRSPGSVQSGNRPGTGEASADASEDPDDVVIPAKLTDRQLLLKAWGEMPGQLQEQRGSSISPRFLPRYQRLIREYYQRMSR